MMKGEDWFRSPSHKPNSNGHGISYGNLYTPSPSSHMESVTPQHQPSIPTNLIFHQIPNMTKFQEEMLHRYIIELPSYSPTSNLNPPPTPPKPFPSLFDLTLSPALSKLKPSQRRYKIRSESQKIQIVKFTQVHGLTLACKKYKVSINNICRWRKRCERKIGAGRKVADPVMERKLLEWIRQQGTVNKREMRNKAIELCRDVKFKGSKGWFQRLKARHPWLEERIV